MHARAFYVRVHVATYSTFTQVAVEIFLSHLCCKYISEHPFKCASATITLALGVSLSLSLTYVCVQLTHWT